MSELGLFGSRVRGDHRPDSDLDVLVTFRPDGPSVDLIRRSVELDAVMLPTRLGVVGGLGSRSDNLKAAPRGHDEFVREEVRVPDDRRTNWPTLDRS